MVVATRATLLVEVLVGLVATVLVVELVKSLVTREEGVVELTASNPEVDVAEDCCELDVKVDLVEDCSLIKLDLLVASDVAIPLVVVVGAVIVCVVEVFSVGIVGVALEALVA